VGLAPKDSSAETGLISGEDGQPTARGLQLAAKALASFEQRNWFVSQKRRGQFDFGQRRFEHILIPIIALFEDRVRFAKNIAAGSHRFGFGDFRSRTPGPPPFSSMNSMPLASNAA
jgi:hypothetical protein